MIQRQERPGEGIDGCPVFTSLLALLSGGLRTLDAGEPIFIDLGRPPDNGLLLLLVGHHQWFGSGGSCASRGSLQGRGRIAYAETDLLWP